MKGQNVNPKNYRLVVATDNPLSAYFGKKFFGQRAQLYGAVQRSGRWLPLRPASVSATSRALDRIWPQLPTVTARHSAAAWSEPIL